MSPTLLEATIAVLLLWLAWQIGTLIAPRVSRWFARNFSRSRPDSFPAAREKNITPHGPSSK